jgi:CzcA family heavy metal efflux pump
MNFFEFTKKHVRAVSLLLCGMCLLGAITLANLPVAIFPNLTIPRIIIAAEGGDAPAESILVSVTKPIEDAMSTVPQLRLVQSQTVRGSAGFTLSFADGTDMAGTLQLVNAKLAELHGTLPSDVKTTAERLNSTVFPVLDYSISSKSRSLADLRTLALYTIRPRVARVPGVARVLVNGGDTKEMLVTARPDRLAAYQVALSQIGDAITKANTISAVGGFDSRYQHQLVLVSGLLTDAASVRSVVVVVKNRVPVTVGDLADVAETVQRKTVIATGAGREAVLMNIIRQPEGNTIQVAADVEKELAALRASLPSDVILTPFYDQSEIVKESAVSVVEAIAIGGLLALIVISWFLRNLRSAIVALSLLPLTVLASFIALKLLGMSLNIMTLGAMAIALGLVIDDSIVVVEHMFQRIEEGAVRDEAVTLGLRDITPAMFASSLSTIVVFLPLMLLPGVTGNFFAPLAETLIATLLISLLFSLTLIPFFASLLFPKIAHVTGHGSKAKRPGIYSKLMHLAFRAKWLVVLLIVPIGFATAFFYNGLETGFMPEFDEGAFVIDYKMPAGTSLIETDRVMKQLEDILGHADGVLTWSRLTGAQSGSGLEITPQNQGDLLVRLRQGKRPASDEVMSDVRQEIQKAIPNVEIDLKQILGDLIGDLAGAPSPVEVKIFGPDINQLKKIAEDVSSRIGTVKGVVDVSGGIIESGPEALVMLDPIRAAEMGFSADTFSSAATGALEGEPVGSIRKGDVLEPIRVRYPYSRESTQEQLRKLQLVNPTGQPVPVDSVSTVTVGEGTPQLNRENQRLMDSVTARLEGVDLGSGIAAVQAKLSDLSLPQGYSFELGGLYKSQQESFGALRNVLLTASGLVFMVLLFTFRSFRVSIALFLAAVLALSGVIFALWLTQTPLNISSYTGAIMIVGIVTENGILLFDEFRRVSRTEHRTTDVRLLEAGLARLRPILMTTFAAILTLFPLALGLGAGAAMQKPLAVAVIGGLAFSTFFTLIFAPILYSAMTHMRALFHKDLKDF